MSYQTPKSGSKMNKPVLGGRNSNINYLVHKSDKIDIETFLSVYVAVNSLSTSSLDKPPLSYTCVHLRLL